MFDDKMHMDEGGGDNKEALLSAIQELIKVLQESQLSGVRKTEVEVSPEAPVEPEGEEMDPEKLKMLLGKK